MPLWYASPPPCLLWPARPSVSTVVRTSSAMCRRPLLPLLALAVLMVNLPSSHALKCYQCAGTTSRSDSVNGNKTGLVPLHVSKDSESVGLDISCDNFDTTQSKYQMQCSFPLDQACGKNVQNGKTILRGCANVAADQCNDVGNGLTQCLCTSSYCNSAGVAAPALLLLLPAALLAIFYTSQ